jgi:6-phosphogluconolactonase (cycloisomerase 2 family)
MKLYVTVFLTLTIALDLAGQETSAKSLVITTNDRYQPQNSASSYEFNGTGLTALPRLQTGGAGSAKATYGSQQQAIAKAGSNLCAFVADSASSDVASFNITNLVNPIHVGSYFDQTGFSGIGIAMAKHGSLLFVAYSSSKSIGAWGINLDCSLTLLNPASNTITPFSVDALAVTPDGKTLIATYATTSIGSFEISGSALGSRGSQNATAPTGGLDITRDSKFAIAGDASGLTEISVFPINSDGSLGLEDYYSVPQGGADSNNVWLSPDESVLYVSNNISMQITTLAFNEAERPGQRLTFECLSNPLRRSPGGAQFNIAGIATQAASGKGGYLYVAERQNPAAIGLMQIPDSGCPTEVPDSPFANTPGRTITTLSTYPARPF